jgi:hypothetical protein
MIGDEVVVGVHQLKAHRDRKPAADHTRADGKDQIERADVLMVGREQPAGEKSRLTRVAIRAVAVFLDRVRFPLVRHKRPSCSQLPAGAGKSATRTAAPFV